MVHKGTAFLDVVGPRDNHSGSTKSYDYVREHNEAMKRVQEGLAAGEVVTGLLYVDPSPKDLHDHLNTVAAPLNTLDTPDLCPGPSALERINAGLR